MSGKNAKMTRKIVRKQKKSIAVQLIKEVYAEPLPARAMFALRIIFRK